MNNLPTIERIEHLLTYLKKYESLMKKTLKLPRPLKAVWNFKSTSKRGGNLLELKEAKGADGYVLLVSEDSDFSTVDEVLLKSGVQNSFFHALSAGISGAAGPGGITRFYKIVPTSGTQLSPQSVRGRESGIVFQTSIDSTDQTTEEITTSDTTTSDESQVGAGSIFEQRGGEV